MSLLQRPARSDLRSPWLVLAVASLAIFVVFLDTQVLFVAFNDLRADFSGVSEAQLSWVLSAYTIVLAATLVPAGRMADRYGRRRVFLGGLAAFTVASALCAAAPGPELLVAFRGVQALGAAALLPASLALVLSVFPPSRVPVAVAVWGSVGALAAAVGPTIGALLVEGFGWRSVFLVNLPVGLVTLWWWRDVLPESRESTRARFPDPLGTVLLALGVALLALGIVQSDAWAWGSVRTVSALVGGLIVVAAFVLRTLRVPNPALDLELFRLPSFRWGNIASAAFMVGFTAMFFANIQFLTQVWGYGIVRAGLAMMPGPLVVMLLAPVMGRVAARVGQRRLLVPGGLVYAASSVLYLVAIDADPAWATRMLPASLLAGLGVALVIPQLASASVQGLPRNDLGAGSAVNQAIRQLGATFGIALTVTLLGAPGSPDALTHFHRVWWMLVACGALTSFAALWLPRRSQVAAPVAGPSALALPLPVAE